MKSKSFLIALFVPIFFFVSCGKKPIEIVDKVNVQIDYDQPIAEAIQLGRYCNVDEYILKNTPPKIHTGKISASIYLYRFNNGTSAEDAITELDKIGFRPAELSECMALGAQHPHLQEKYDLILALGSVIVTTDGYHCSPVLGKFGNCRDIGIFWAWGGGTINRVNVFAALSK